MALRMYLGKPGGGKSYGALREIIEELVWGSRNVCTNLSLLPGEVNAYIQMRYPQADVDLDRRLRILTDKEARRFWLHRAPGVDIPDVTKEAEKSGMFPDFASYAGAGTFFVIDEAHVYFDARAWMDSGQSLTYYNSQHRKLNDELIFVTQFLELIDKRVRGFTQEYWYFRNNGMEKLFTLFRMPEYFSVRVYQFPVTGAAGGHPSEVHRYKLILPLAKCYDTSAGVGISGRKKPEEKKKRGLPVWILGLVALAAAAGLVMVPEMFSRAFVSSVGGTSAPVPAPAPVPARVPPPSPQSHSVDAVAPVGRPADAPSSPSWSTPAPLWVSGYIVRNGRVNVVFSDGRVLSEVDPDLVEIHRNGVVVASGFAPYSGDKYAEGRKVYLRSVGSGSKVDPVRGARPAGATLDAAPEGTSPPIKEGSGSPRLGVGQAGKLGISRSSLRSE